MNSHASYESQISLSHGVNSANLINGEFAHHQHTALQQQQNTNAAMSLIHGGAAQDVLLPTTSSAYPGVITSAGMVTASSDYPGVITSAGLIPAPPVTSHHSKF